MADMSVPAAVCSPGRGAARGVWAQVLRLTLFTHESRALSKEESVLFRRGVDQPAACACAAQRPVVGRRS
jgi:hypothetical protein